VTAYVDASVILRLAFGQPNALAEWPTVQRGVASALVTTESLRSLDRLRLRAKLSDEEVATRRAAILSLIASLEVVELDANVLDRASQPMPTELGTLDAIHLTTALLWKAMTAGELTMATHDDALGIAAKAYGLPVIGTSGPPLAV
jgi:predicted nucleic acid-binding protein